MGRPDDFSQRVTKPVTVGGPASQVAPEASAEPLKARARSLAASKPPKLRLPFAQAFTASLITHYWTKLEPRPKGNLRAAPTGVGKRLGREELAVAAGIAELAAARGIDEAGYLVGSTYAAMLPDDFRSERGVYYTPPAVVRRLLDSATSAGVDWTAARVLDPACGGGAFLGPVVRRMATSLRGCERRVALRNLNTRLAGFELDPFAAWMSLVFLDATLEEELGITTSGDFDPISVCNSLERHHDEAYDLVIGNPPYGRVSLSAELRKTYERSLFGHANLYGLFLDLAIRKTAPGGVIAFVTPTSFLSGEYYKKLRSLLASHAPPVTLEFVSERSGVFDDVLQETMLAVFRRRPATGKAKAYFVEVDAGSVRVTSAGDVPVLAGSDGPWIVPRTAAAALTADVLHELPSRLADWGYGVSTGPLVWNRFKERLRERASKGTVPLIWAEAVSADGTFAFRAERRNHSPYFLAEEGEEFLLIKRSCVLLQRTTAKEQVRRLIAAELPQEFIDEHGAITVENHLNMLVPIVAKPAVDTATLAAFLNSAAADRAFRCINGSVAVSAYELEAMPLPDPGSMDLLTELLRRKPSREQIDLVCDELYAAP